MLENLNVFPKVDQFDPWFLDPCCLGRKDWKVFSTNSNQNRKIQISVEIDTQSCRFCLYHCGTCVSDFLIHRVECSENHIDFEYKKDFAWCSSEMFDFGVSTLIELFISELEQMSMVFKAVRPFEHEQ